MLLLRRCTSLLGALVLVLLLAPGCSSDDKKPDGGNTTADQGGPPPDGNGPQPDGPVPVGDSNKLPWPDQSVKPDLSNVSCSPGDPAMCDEDKTLHCKDGKCAPCPTAYVDCDRQGDCECFGACDGDKCATKGGGKP